MGPKFMRRHSTRRMSLSHGHQESEEATPSPSPPRERHFEVSIPMVMLNEVVPTRYLHEDTLLELNLYTEVMELLNRIGWLQFARLHKPTYEGLTREVLDSFNCDMFDMYEQIDRPGVITFSLLGTSHAMSIHDFGTIFGFPRGHYQIPTNFSSDLTWNTLSDGSSSYDPLTSSVCQLRNPAHRYLCAWLSYNICGGGSNPRLVSRSELFFLHCMIHNEPVNGAPWLCTLMNFTNCRQSGRIMIGGYITVLADHFGNGTHRLNEVPLRGGALEIDGKTLENLGLCSFRNGTYHWIDHEVTNDPDSIVDQ